MLAVRKHQQAEVSNRSQFECCHNSRLMILTSIRPGSTLALGCYAIKVELQVPIP
jgi:hypothetical protein